ncbi:hypothetical protein ACM66B_005058 [Microbotryomycetes sp. NB124-2]
MSVSSSDLPAPALTLTAKLLAARDNLQRLQNVLSEAQQRVTELEEQLNGLQATDIEAWLVVQQLLGSSGSKHAHQIDNCAHVASDSEWTRNVIDATATASESPLFGPIDSLDIQQPPSQQPSLFATDLCGLDEIPDLSSFTDSSTADWLSAALMQQQSSSVSWSSTSSSFMTSPGLSPFVNSIDNLSLGGLSTPLSLDVGFGMLPPPLCPVDVVSTDTNRGHFADGAASVPLAATSSSAGRQPRRASSVRSTSARFNPMQSVNHARSHSINDDILVGAASSNSAAHVPSILLQLSAATPLPVSPELVAIKDTSSLSRSSSLMKKQRTPRKTCAEDVTVYRKNSSHLFAVHIQTKTKAEVTEDAIVPLLLSFDTPSSLPLARAASTNEPYTDDFFQQDCRDKNVYLFVAPAQRQTWIVQFSQFGPQALLQESSESCRDETTKLKPIYTFVHFLPQDVVVQPAFPIGSRQWWRVQECPRHHPGRPLSNQSWTARTDDSSNGGEQKRPNRVVTHFATCKSKIDPSINLQDGQGGVGQTGWALERLARAIQNVLPSG